MVSLKTKNEPHLIAAMVLNGILFYSYINSMSFSPTRIIGRLETWEQGGVVAILLALATNVVVHLLPRELKDFFVYWQWPAAPGHRAFSHYVRGDSRIDMAKLHARVPDSNNPALTAVQQNSIWFRLLKQFEDRPEVVQAHGRWLLFRDLTTLLWLFLIVFVLVWIVGNPVVTSWAYFSIVCGELALVSIAARNSGIALVRNVLALATV